MTNIKPITRSIAGIVAAAMLGSGSIAPAAVISVNFIETPGNASQQIDSNETFGVASFNTVVGGWINATATVSTLTDSQGNSTPVGMVSVLQPNGRATFNSAYTNTPLFAGLDDYTATATPTSVTLSNLATHFPYGYRVIAYVGGFNSCSNASISDGSTTFYYQTIKSPVWPVAFTQTTVTSNPGNVNAPVAQYAVFGETTLLTNNTLTLTVDTLYGGGAGLCGFQIVGIAATDPVPRLLTSEGFDSSGYTANVSLINNATLGFGFDGPWTGYGGQVKILANSLIYSGYGADGENRVQLTNNSAIRRSFLTGNNGPLGNHMDTNGTISLSRNGSPLYLAFLFAAPTNQSPGGNLSLFLSNYNASNRLFAVQLNTNAPFAISVTAPSTGTPQVLGNNNNAANLVVARFDFAGTNGTIRLWLNPVAGGSEPSPNVILTNITIAFDRLQLTHGFVNFAIEFDEIRFGNDWAATVQSSGLATLPGSQSLVGMKGLPPSPIGGTNYPREFFPFVDAFGQYRHLDWSNKVQSVTELRQSATNETADFALNPGPSQWCEYGGWLNGPQLTATGFFRVQKYQGDWWFVDPHGHLFWSHGVTGLNSPGIPTAVTDRQNYFANLPLPGESGNEFYEPWGATVASGYYGGSNPLTMDFMAANALAKYGTNWSALTKDLNHTRLRSWGMNTIGSWTASDAYLLRRTPYARVFYPFVGTINGDSRMPDYFNPAFATSLTNVLSGPERNDPWCIGFYINNELEWTRPSALPDRKDVGLTALAAVNTSFAKGAFQSQLIAKYSTIGALNAQWGTAYSSWTDFVNQRTTFPSGSSGDADLNAFYRAYAEQFYSTSAEVIHGHTSNLFLGSRFAGSPHTDAARACTNHVDVATINQYNNTASIPAGLEADIPVMITEHNFCADDSGLFWEGLNFVASQSARASSYTSYFNSAANSSRFVGKHWFQFLDRSTTGILNSDADGNNNNGLVDVTDTPYAPVIAAARSAGQIMYSQRLGTTPPTITAITNRTIYKNTNTGAIAFTIGDDITAVGSLVLSKTSSNTNLVPTANIVFGGSGANRTVTITPLTNQIGTTTITITVADAKGARGFATFNLTVIAPATPPTLGAFTINGSQFQMTVSGDAGANYFIQASTNLVDWLTVFTNLNATPPFPWTDTQTTNFPSRFYRALIGP